MQSETLFNLVFKEQCSAIDNIIKLIKQFIAERPNKEIKLNENAIMNNVKYIMVYQNDKGDVRVKYESNGSAYDERINIFTFYDLGCIASVIKNHPLITFKWVADSDDGCFHDESKKSFETEAEAYKDMRNAALEKIKWNTEYDEDYLGDEYDGNIEYKINFSRNKIIHESYSGIYTYQLVKEC